MYGTFRYVPTTGTSYPLGMLRFLPTRLRSAARSASLGSQARGTSIDWSREFHFVAVSAAEDKHCCDPRRLASRAPDVYLKTKNELET